MLLNVLMALTVIMITARVLGAIFARLHQPAVTGRTLVEPSWGTSVGNLRGEPMSIPVVFPQKL